VRVNGVSKRLAMIPALDDWIKIVLHKN